jgi:hypothetical protein
VEIANELASKGPHVVDVFLDCLRRQIRCCQVLLGTAGNSLRSSSPGGRSFSRHIPRASRSARGRSVRVHGAARLILGVVLGSLRCRQLRTATHCDSKSVPLLSGIHLPIRGLSGHKSIGIEVGRAKATGRSVRAVISPAPETVSSPNDVSSSYPSGILVFLVNATMRVDCCLC